MSNTVNMKGQAVLSRIAFFALLLITMTAGTLHLGARTSHAAQATLSWAAPTTYTDGKALTSLKGYKVYTGTASGSYSQNVDVGNVKSYTMSGLNDGTTYYFAVTAYDTSGYASGFSNQATFTTPAGTTTTSTLYTVTASAGAGGSITPSGSIAISKGLNQSFAIAPATGYKIADVKVDGASVGAVAGYTFSSVAANHSIAASFAANTSTTGSFSITASSSTGGTISPAGASTVLSGGSKSYTITPNAGYYLASVSVDGKVIASNLANYSYTFSNVTASHTISATFAVATYTLTASAGANGSISPTGTVYANYGSSTTYTITPATGYAIAAVTVDGASVGAVSSYTFTNVKAKHTIAATFAAKTTGYTITATWSGAGGSISPAGAVTVASGTSKTFAITPGSGYKIAGVTVDGASVGAVSSYTFSNVTTKHSISATFTASTAASVNIPHTAWKLKWADSQELTGQNGSAANAFDVNNGSIWHSQWLNGSPTAPHEIQIDLGKSYSLNNFSYLPRQDGSSNGTIARYEFYVSGDGVNWGTPVAAGTFANSAALKQASFAIKAGRYIRLRALSEVNGNPWTSAAEINVAGY